MRNFEPVCNSVAKISYFFLFILQDSLMWLLYRRGEDSDIRYWLCAGTKYVVGRKEGECDLLVQNDRSISRAHADVLVEDEYDVHNLKSRPDLTIKDTSRYGTKVNGTALTKKVTKVVEGDEIQFGVFGSIFKLQWIPITICLTKTSPETKTQLQRDIITVGGHITVVISECTHLVSDVVYPSTVVVSGLALGIPLVTFEWLAALASRRAASDAVPQPSLFIPPPSPVWMENFPECFPENMITGSVFDQNVLRIDIYKDMCFVFLTKESYTKHCEIITHCKGTPMNASNEAAELTTAKGRIGFLVRHQKSIIVSPPDNNTGVLRKMGFRPVKETDLTKYILLGNCSPLKSIKKPVIDQEKQRYIEKSAIGVKQVTQLSSATTRIDSLTTTVARCDSEEVSDGEILIPATGTTQKSATSVSTEARITRLGTDSTSHQPTDQNTTPFPNSRHPPSNPEYDGAFVTQISAKLVVGVTPLLNSDFPCYAQCTAAGVKILGKGGKNFKKQRIAGTVGGAKSPLIVVEHQPAELRDRVVLTQGGESVAAVDLIDCVPDRVSKKRKKSPTRKTKRRSNVPQILQAPSRVDALRSGTRGMDRARIAMMTAFNMDESEF